MKFLPVLKWMINITLFVALAAGGAAVYVWKNSDSFVHQEVLKQFHLAAPELRLIIGGTTLHGTRGATLGNVEIRERATDRPLFGAKELHVAIHSDRLLQRQTFPHAGSGDRLRVDRLLQRETFAHAGSGDRLRVGRSGARR